MTAFMARPNRNITFCKQTSRWKVKIVRKGTEYFLGRFDTIEEARAARDAFEDPWKEALEARAAYVAGDASAPVPKAPVPQLVLPVFTPAPLHSDPDHYITYMKRDNSHRVKITRGNFDIYAARFATVEAARAARDAFREREAMTVHAQALWKKYRTTRPSKRPAIAVQLQAMIDSGIPEPIVLATQP